MVVPPVADPIYWWDVREQADSKRRLFEASCRANERAVIFFDSCSPCKRLSKFRRSIVPECNLRAVIFDWHTNLLVKWLRATEEGIKSFSLHCRGYDRQSLKIKTSLGNFLSLSGGARIRRGNTRRLHRDNDDTWRANSNDSIALLTRWHKWILPLFHS